MRNPLRKIPNLLTGFRCAVIPVFVATFFFDSKWMNQSAAALFIIACITDFLDGYLARLWSVQSSLGRFLDPIADKLLVAAALIMLMYKGRADVIPALLIISREILVSGLREYLSEIQVPLPVSRLGKWKTGIQMGALLLLILGEKGTGLELTDWLGRIALWISAGITVYSGYAYLKASAQHIDFE